MHKLRFINTVLYRLQHSYGIPVTLYKVITETNIDTGEITETFTIKKIRRALVEPTTEIRSFIASGMDFIKGGFFDPADRFIIVDRKRDIPHNWGDINLNQFFMVNDRKFSIKTIQEYENNSAIVFFCRETQGQVLTHMANIISVLSLDQSLEVAI